MLTKPHLILLLLIFIALAGCSKRTSPALSPDSGEYSVQDLKTFPQNLEVFAREYGAHKRLLSLSRQESLARNFQNIFFGPWAMKRTSIPRRDAGELLGRARGYKNGDIRWSQPEMDALSNNANLSTYPSRAQAAITVRATDLRGAPTHEARFTEPTPDVKANPFDYFQYSFLSIGTPLFIAHTSRDGLWHYVECPIAGGWVDARDVASVTPEFQHSWKTGQYAAIIAENVILPGTGNKGLDSRAGIGTLLPLIGEANNALQVLIPVKGRDGTAKTAEISLARQQAVRQPMPMTAGNVAEIGNAMMGQPYGWGGMLGLRDCSAMLRDIFTPFGIWLPRNSRAQARRGQITSLQGMSIAEKEKTILREGVPFLSLVGMPGHITLYVGKWQNQAAIFHNVWGVRIIKDGNNDERQVIGRAVVTSIKPGNELKNLYRPITFADRLKTLTTTRNEN